MDSQNIKKIEQILGSELAGYTKLSGGDIGNSYKVSLASGLFVFCKLLPQQSETLIREARGLKELNKAAAIRIPNVLHADEDLLILEFITANRSITEDFFRNFGRRLANLHRYQGDVFGFFEDNFIGLTPQKNTPTASYNPASKSGGWAAFYFEYRLLFQYKLLEKNGYGSGKLKQLFNKLGQQIESILDITREPPSLLHGDLWSGNFLADEDHNPCLIDPATYYGHREADLAMTSLFGGFPPAFYEAYQEDYPLAPNYNEREPLYQLYHLMNHTNLFGSSYLPGVISILKKYA